MWLTLSRVAGSVEVKVVYSESKEKLGQGKVAHW